MAIVTTPRSGKCGGFGGFGGGEQFGFGGGEQFGFELPVSIGIPFGGFGGFPCHCF